MENLFDEFSKSLAESVPRRESLRRLGAVFAGAILSPLGVETAWAGKVDPCKAFCKCRNAKQQNQCFAACKACNGNTGRLGGSCGTYVCCCVAACKGVCNDLRYDPNCGACGNNWHCAHRLQSSSFPAYRLAQTPQQCESLVRSRNSGLADIRRHAITASIPKSAGIRPHRGHLPFVASPISKPTGPWKT
jgi:hypothetical protein